MEPITKSHVQLVRQLQQKKHRIETGLFVAEGEKCIGEMLPYFELVLRADSSNATPLQLEQMSAMRSPQGSVAVFRIPDRVTPAMSDIQDLILALDGIQDPGNLGTIIRTADWFGIRHIYASSDTVDCFNPKVVQATMGALGRVQVHYVDLAACLHHQSSIINHQSSIINHQSSLPIYGTMLEGRNIYQAGAITDRKRGVIVMGNEGNGLSPEVRQLVTHPLLIPACISNETPDHVESLNVSIATAIILSEFRRPA